MGSVSFLRSIGSLVARGQYTAYAAVIEKFSFFLFFVALARRLGVAEYGGIVAVFALCNVLQSFFECGFHFYFQREAAARNPSLAAEFRSALLFRLAIAAIYPLLLILLMPATAAVSLPNMMMIAASVYLFGFAGMYAGLLNGFEAYRTHAGIVLISRILLVAAAAVFFAGSLAPEAALGGVLLSAAVQCLLALRSVHRSPGFTGREARAPRMLRRILRSSMPIGAGLIFVWIYDKIDVVLIQGFLGSRQVSYYAVAYSVYRIPQMALGVILTPLFTDLSRSGAVSPIRRWKDAAPAALVMLLLAVASIFLFRQFDRLILTLTYGAGYGESDWILRGLAAAIPGLFFNNLTGVLLNSRRRERAVMATTFAAMLLNLAVNILFLPRWGVAAAIAATVATEYFLFAAQLTILLRGKEGPNRESIVHSVPS